MHDVLNSASLQVGTAVVVALLSLVVLQLLSDADHGARCVLGMMSVLQLGNSAAAVLLIWFNGVSGVTLACVAAAAALALFSTLMCAVAGGFGGAVPKR